MITHACLLLLFQGRFGLNKPVDRSATSPPVDVQLSVNSTNGHVIAHLRFTNSSKKPVHLLKWMLCVNGHAQADVFSVKFDNRGVARRRIMGKYSSRPEDYIVLKPNASLETDAAIDEDYELPGGKHDYSIQYDAYLGMPPDEDLYNVKSNEVRFSFTSSETPK
jgi:hypothetical protein